jgi:5-methylcytosine-specific restriction endonuclease McrA
VSLTQASPFVSTRSPDVSHTAVIKAVKAGKIPLVDGKVDPAAADTAWECSRDGRQPSKLAAYWTGSDRVPKAPPLAGCSVLQYARSKGISPSAVYAAVHAAGIPLVKGRVDPAALDAARGRLQESELAAFHAAFRSGVKKCSQCLHVKQFSGFSKGKTCRFGVQSICKACHSAKWNPIQQEKAGQARLSRPPKTPKTKTCTRCHTTQPVSAYVLYSQGPNRPQKHSTVCGECLTAAKLARTVRRLETGEKRCPICRTFKPLEAFNKLRSSVDGHRPECHECRIESRRQERVKGGVELRKRQRADAKMARDEARQQAKANRPPKLTPEEIAERGRRKSRRRYGANLEYERRRVAVYKRANAEKAERWGDTRWNRVAAQADGTLTPDVIVHLFCAARSCPYCAAELAESNKSLDHLDPIKHGGAHGISNVVICCRHCNNRKSGRPFAQWLELLLCTIASKRSVCITA